MISKLTSMLVVLVSAFLFWPYSFVQAEDTYRQDLWGCAVYNRCKSGLSPNRARSGLDKYDQQGVDKARKQLERIERDQAIKCIVYSKCAGEMTKEDAWRAFDEIPTPPSSEERVEAARQCYIFGSCASDEVSGDRKKLLPEYEQRALEAEKKRQLARNESDWKWERVKCASRGQCKRPMTPEKAKTFDQMDSFDRALHRCAAGFGCPDGINRDQATALTDREHILWKERDTAKAVEPKIPEPKHEEKEGTIGVEENHLIFKAPETEPDLFFDDSDVAEEIEKRQRSFERKATTASKAQNPFVGLAASVVAEAPRQSTPIFFSEAELLRPRLPRLTGDGDFEVPGFDNPEEDADVNLDQQDPDIEKLGEPRPMQGETFESIAAPSRAPETFRLERSNEENTYYGSSQVFSAVWGKVDHDGWPGVRMRAEIVAEQIKAEKRGAKRIANPPKAEVSSWIYIPIDDGGVEIEAETLIFVQLPDEGIGVTVIPYTEDSIQNLFLTQQAFSVVSAGADSKALAARNIAHGFTGIAPPLVGNAEVWSQFFDFPETRRGDARGLLVMLEGSAVLKEAGRVDTKLGNNLVTQITTKANQKASVVVKLQTVRVKQ